MYFEVFETEGKFEVWECSHRSKDKVVLRASYGELTEAAAAVIMGNAMVKKLSGWSRKDDTQRWANIMATTAEKRNMDAAGVEPGTPKDASENEVISTVQFMVEEDESEPPQAPRAPVSGMDFDVPANPFARNLNPNPSA